MVCCVLLVDECVLFFRCSEYDVGGIVVCDVDDVCGGYYVDKVVGVVDLELVGYWCFGKLFVVDLYWVGGVVIIVCDCC